MSGFDKIELRSPAPTKSVKRTDFSTPKEPMARKKKFKLRMSRPAAITLGVLIVLLLLAGVFIGIPAKHTYTLAMQTVADEKLFAQAVKQQNIDDASTQLDKTKADLVATQQSLHSIGILHFIPVANWYYNDADHLLKADDYGLRSATDMIDALKPYADVLGLKGAGSFTSGSASDRIKTAVLTMGKITPKIDDISDNLVAARGEIDGVGAWHYPKLLFGNKIETELQQVQNLTDEGVTFINNSRPLIKVLPSLLGESEPKKYLVIFQNDKELRPTGGFMTGYSIFNIDKGVIQAEKSEDIYTLDASIEPKPKAPAPIQKYFPTVYTFNLRDSNLSPDFITSMDQFKKFYAQSTEKENYDGIVALDTDVLVRTIKDLDNTITADGQTFNTDTDSHCNCPEVIYALENNISRPVNYIKADRKSLLGSLLVAIMQKALSSSPKQYWGPLFQDMIMLTNQKHILFDLNDTSAQQGLEALNAAGQIRPFDGDYLHINEANFSGAKTNLFVNETVDMNYKPQSDGTIQKIVTIKWTNPFPPSDCNLEHGGLCLNSTHRDWVRLYVPKGSQLVSETGSQVKMTTYDDLGKTVFDGFITVRPNGGATTLTVTYTLPFKVSGNSLPVLVQKQPGTEGFTYTISKNDVQKDQFQLFNDTEKKVQL